MTNQIKSYFFGINVLQPTQRHMYTYWLTYMGNKSERYTIVDQYHIKILYSVTGHCMWCVCIDESDSDDNDNDDDDDDAGLVASVLQLDKVDVNMMPRSVHQFPLFHSTNSIVVIGRLALSSQHRPLTHFGANRNPFCSVDLYAVCTLMNLVVVSVS